MARAVAAFLVAGASSGVGKTTVTTGIAGALRRRGLAVQPYKVGPDYIDPGYLTRVSGRPCRNLDSWMVPADVLRELYTRAVAGVDIAVVEGVMGLYDGHPGQQAAGSSAEISRLLGLPVVLVVDVGKMAQSAAAVVLGYAQLDPRVHVVGVIANNVGSPGHAHMVTRAVEEGAGLPVLGCLPRRKDLVLPERHLGLIPTSEERVSGDFFACLVDHVEERVDLDRLVQLAQQARPVVAAPTGIFPSRVGEATATIGLARDEAFSFYYQDNLDLLAAWGARLVPFSPLHDASLPAGVQGLYLGGGFPEVFAAQLAANEAMRRCLRQAHASGMPIYAECGGLMYLCESLVAPDGGRHPMVGLVPARAAMGAGRAALGYRVVKARRDTVLLPAGELARGHEFHWSRLDEPWAAQDAAYEVVGEGRPEGHARGNLLASYVHLHFASNRCLAPNFVAACARWGGRT